MISKSAHHVRIVVAALVCAAALLTAAHDARAQAIVHVVAFATNDEQDVFAREARQAAAIAHQAFGGPDPVVRVNSRAKPAAMIADLKEVLAEVGAAMKEGDLLFLLITSHGTPAGVMVKSRKTTEVLSPAELDDTLAKSGIKRRIIVISACYSGIFADAIANASTLVITASDAHHPSFGCRNGNDWTYFGRAFFEDSLRKTRDLQAAFSQAVGLIGRRETAMHFEHSNPQLAGGAEVLARLGQAPAAGSVAAAPAETDRAGCVLKVEPLPDMTTCKVFNGYSNGRRVGYFRLGAPRPKANRIGVAADGTCPADFVKGELIGTSKLRAGADVFTLTPDCRSAIRTTQ